MKNYQKIYSTLLLLIIVVLFTGCKSRQVSITHNILNQDSLSKWANSFHTSNIDTSKIKSTGSISNSGTDLFNLKSNGQVLTIIYPSKSGTITFENGTFKGSADSIKTNHIYNTDDTRNANHTLTGNFSFLEHQGISRDSFIAESTLLKSNLQRSGDDKKVTSKPDYHWIWYVTAVLAVVLIIVFLYFKIKGGWLTGIFKLFSTPKV